MTRTATRRKIKRKPAIRKIRPPKPTSDRAIYLGIVVIGFFAVMLASLFSQINWSVFAIVYLALIAYLINVTTFHVYRGNHLANWQQALARIPLRFAGYGTKDGKPLEAAHDHPETRNALLLCMTICVILVGGLAFIAWRTSL